MNMLKDNQITDWLEINGLKNIIKEPTCFKGCLSLIDVIITNKPKRFQNSVSVDTGLSDFHNMVCVSTKFHLPKHKETTISYRSYKSFDRSNYLHDLSVAPFHVAEIFDDIDDSYWFWNTMMRDITNVYAPVKTRTLKGNRVPYMNGELRRYINVKHMLKRKHSRCNSSVNWENYRKQCNIVTQLRRKSVKMYMRNKCRNAKNNGKFWKAVKPLISNKVINKDDNMFIYIDGNVVNDPSDLCRVFNTYFTNIAYNIGLNDTIYGSDSSESCIHDYAAHRSVNQITNLMDTAHTGRAEFNFEMIHVSTVKAFNSAGYKESNWA